MTAPYRLVGSLALVALCAAGAPAADQTILGRVLLVRSSVVRVAGIEDGTNTVVGDPRVMGATLRIYANGTTDSSQTISLPAQYWEANFQNGYGFFPRGNAGAVKYVRIRKSFANKFFLKAKLLASLGPVTVVPPNLGDDGGMVLTIPGGDRYCTTFGGASGGMETADAADIWRIVRATAEPGCPPGSPSGAFLETATSLLE